MLWFILASVNRLFTFHWCRWFWALTRYLLITGKLQKPFSTHPVLSAWVNPVIAGANAAMQWENVNSGRYFDYSRENTSPFRLPSHCPISLGQQWVRGHQNTLYAPWQIRHTFLFGVRGVEFREKSHKYHSSNTEKKTQKVALGKSFSYAHSSQLVFSSYPPFPYYQPWKKETRVCLSQLSTKRVSTEGNAKECWVAARETLFLTEIELGLP